MTTSAKKFLVFQHIDVEHPGVFRDFLAEDGIQWDAVELDQGEKIPPLTDYDALWVMGGPMDAWEEAEHPWLVNEKSAIREAVLELNMPYLGVCLGHQLLADALGGEVGPSDTPEIGILQVSQTNPSDSHGFFAGLPENLNCLQWHSAEVKQIPANAQTLLSSDACRHQSIAINRALGIQFHIEITPDTVQEWGQVPAYKTALEKSLGPDALDEFDALASDNMEIFNRYAKQLYKNWLLTTFN